VFLFLQTLKSAAQSTHFFAPSCGLIGGDENGKK
jgi:hypothetical protein